MSKQILGAMRHLGPAVLHFGILGLTVTSALVLGAASASAGDMTWTGFYVGGNVGAAWADYASKQSGDGGEDVIPDLHPYPGGEVNGTFWGGQAGYNWQMNFLVLGVEGDLGGIDVSDTSSTPCTSDDGCVGSVQYGAYGVIAGRLGLAVDRALFYAKGGAAWADIKNRSYEIGEGGVPIEFDEDHRANGTKSGWALGGGFEYALNDRWSSKVEYLHMDFDTEKVRNLEGDTIEFDNKVDTVKFGINYRFGAWHTQAPATVSGPLK